METVTPSTIWWSRPAARRVVAALTCLTAMTAIWFDVLAHPLLLLYPVFALTYGVTGLLLWSRRSENAVGPLLTVVGVAFLIGAIGTPFGSLSGLPALLEPSLPPILIGNSVAVGSALLLLLPLLRFPDGRLPSPGWRWVERSLIVVMLIGAMTGILADPGYGLQHPFAGERVAASARSAMEGLLSTFPIGLGAVFVAIRVRYRVGDEVERKQLKWLLAAIGTYVAFQAIGQSQRVVFGIQSFTMVGFAIDSLLGTLIPVSILFAILRYRLYEIDRIVSRTVTYAVVALVVAIIYIVPVLALPRFLGKSNDLVVAASTLAAAAVFNPVRRRVHRAVDRRFNRARYDADRELDRFSARLDTEVTIEAVEHATSDLLGRTLSPAAVGIWTRSPT
jgi:hypothetical protein